MLDAGRSDGVEILAAGELAADRRIAGRAAGGHGDRADIAFVDLADEFGIRDRRGRSACASRRRSSARTGRAQTARPAQISRLLVHGLPGFFSLSFIALPSAQNALVPKIGASAPITMRGLGRGEQASVSLAQFGCPPVRRAGARENRHWGPPVQRTPRRVALRPRARANSSWSSSRPRRSVPRPSVARRRRRGAQSGAEFRAGHRPAGR